MQPLQGRWESERAAASPHLVQQAHYRQVARVRRRQQRALQASSCGASVTPPGSLPSRNAASGQAKPGEQLAARQATDRLQRSSRMASWPGGRTSRCSSSSCTVASWSTAAPCCRAGRAARRGCAMRWHRAWGHAPACPHCAPAPLRTQGAHQSQGLALAQAHVCSPARGAGQLPPGPPPPPSAARWPPTRRQG